MKENLVISEIEFVLTNIVGYNPDKLVYFALTSKIEFQLRDRIAFHLYNKFREKYIVTREWKKCDLAILDKESLKPLFLIECKACYGFDLINKGTLKEYVTAINKDFEKSSRIADTDTEIISILFITKPAHNIPENLLPIIKYSKAINRADNKLGAENITTIGEAELTNEFSEISFGHICNGNAYEINCSLDFAIIRKTKHLIT